MQAARWPPRLSFGTMSSSPYRYPNAKELLDAQVEGASVPGGPKHPVTTSLCVCVKLGDTIRCICANRRTHSGRMKSESGISGRRNGRDANTAARRRLARLDMGESCFSADTSADLSSAAVTGDFLRAPLDLQCLCATADVIQSVGENTSSTEARPHFETSAKTRSLNQAPGNFTAEPAGVIKSRYHLATPRDVTECMSLVKSKFLKSSNVAIQTKSKILARRIQAVSANKLRCKTKRTNGTIQRPGLIDSIGGRNDPALGLFPVEADVIEGKRLNHPLLSSRDHDANYSPSLGEAHPVHHSRPLGKLVFPPQTWAVGENTKTLEAIISDVEMVAGDEEASQRIKRLKKRGRVRRYTESHKDDVWLRQGQKYTANYLTIPDPSNQKLNWTKEPLSVLIIRKHLDETVMIPFRDLVIWLVETKKMVVFVEQSVMKDSVLKHDADFKSLRDRLSTFKEGDDLTDKVDFIICLGGDGTLLYVSSLFQRSVPPVMAFNMGSLGFLTPFRFGADYKTEVSKVMQGSASLLLRYRLKCVVVRHDPVAKEDIPHVKNIQKEDAWTKIHKLVLNEVVVDRGPSSYLCNLELYIENRLVTSVQGDGLIISTPSGSTAYAVAAGASMIHPSVPCILITPICPHSLSFRPIVVPAGVELKVNLSPDARGTAMVSFDGRDRKEIHQGDSLRITTAAFPVPSICAADQIEDWFDGLANCLNWNIRHHQRPLQNASSFTSIDSLESPDPQFVTNNSSSADKL